uniref:Ig-like domain-containing protein n=1 Tax=Syphacia muris TaxID=451379 RepID=A0A0N5A8S0_9BILA
MGKGIKKRARIRESALRNRVKICSYPEIYGSAMRVMCDTVCALVDVFDSCTSFRPRVKITDEPFPVANAQALNRISWTLIGTTSKDQVYCVSEEPASQLRFVCLNCADRNVTDLISVLSNAQDLTMNAGFPTVTLRNIPINPNWTGLVITCQASFSIGGIVDTNDSGQTTIEVRYLRNPRVVYQSGRGPVLINQAYRFYVECLRTSEGRCQSGPSKVIRCSVDAQPQAKVFKWLKNGVVTSGNGAEMTINADMIGRSIQCAANNGLYADSEMPTSQAVLIDVYTPARLVETNFPSLRSKEGLFTSDNRIAISKEFVMECIVEGTPRPEVFWRLQKNNGEIVYVDCIRPQYIVENSLRDQKTSQSISGERLKASCPIRIQNYSFTGQYWCAACSRVAEETHECNPSLDTVASVALTVQVEGAPMESDTPPSIDRQYDAKDAVVTVHYCVDPEPSLPRDIIFSVDEHEIQIEQNWQNFKFEGATTNNTVPNCYLARLRINPVREDDQSRNVVLKIQNKYGSKHIVVPLKALLGGEGIGSSSFPAWAVVLICFFCIVLLLTVFVMNVREAYVDDVPRPIYQASGQPAEVMRCESRTDSAYQLYLSKEAVV